VYIMMMKITNLLLVVSSITIGVIRHAFAACNLRGVKNHVTETEQNWTTRNNKLYLGNQVFVLKGMNWNGAESDCKVIHGLWANSLDHYLDLLQDNGFNALRFPMPFESMENLDIKMNPACVTAEPRIYTDMTVGAFLSLLLDTLQFRGMFALFDLHTIGGVITEYPWTDQVSEDRVVDAWSKFGQAVGHHPAVMGFELKNEPHGECSTQDFHKHCAKIIARLDGDGEEKGFKGLYFIDGTAFHEQSAPWGGTFEGISKECSGDELCKLNKPDKIVFAPHVYGPDVRGDVALTEDHTTFERRFGFLKHHAFFNGSAIVVTEFGGHMRDTQGADFQYFERWKQYMKDTNLNAGSFFWTLPPSSADTGGVLSDDWKTIDKHKLDFLDSVQPTPSISC
jgi:endoglucanase